MWPLVCILTRVPPSCREGLGRKWPSDIMDISNRGGWSMNLAQRGQSSDKGRNSEEGSRGTPGFGGGQELSSLGGKASRTPGRETTVGKGLQVGPTAVVGGVDRVAQSTAQWTSGS